MSGYKYVHSHAAGWQTWKQVIFCNQSAKFFDRSKLKPKKLVPCLIKVTLTQIKSIWHGMTFIYLGKKVWLRFTIFLILQKWHQGKLDTFHCQENSCQNQVKKLAAVGWTKRNDWSTSIEQPTHSENSTDQNNPQHEQNPVKHTV